MARFITFKRGGQGGKVGINPELVTDVRSSIGAFTDIFFGEHHITVEGAYEQVVARLSEAPEPRAESGQRQYWLKDSPVRP